MKRAPKPAAAGRGRPAMLMLGGCFMLSAILRAADPASALAVEVPKLAGGGDAPEASAAAAPALEGPTHSDLALLLATLREREAQLDARAADLAAKAKLIEAAKARLSDQMSRLEDAEGRLGALLRIADNAADKDVSKLVGAFQTMEGKRAGPIFENMDTAFAAGLLSRMDEAAAANILAALSPEKAYAVTVHIAGQNAAAPKR